MGSDNEGFMTDSSAQCVFSGNVFKKSDYVGWHNRRYVRLLSKEADNALFLAYWVNERAYNAAPCAPRGLFDLSNCKLTVLAKGMGGRGVMPIQISRVRDTKSSSWGSRSGLIYYFSFVTRVEGEAFKNCIMQDKKRKRSYKEVASCYDILGEIGKGGFSCVYRARPKNESKLVALKVVTLARFRGKGFMVIW